MLKVVKLPMKKIYHYLYSVDDLVGCNGELTDIDSFIQGDEGPYYDVFAYLDCHQYDIRGSVVKRLVEYANRQSGNHS
jgi:hypothetical protein